MTVDPGEVGYGAALQLFEQGRYGEGVQRLGEAAAAGHTPSLTLLGGQLILGRGVQPDPVRGIGMVMTAAAKGGALANSMAATLLASGLAGEADWPRALDHLERSAALGFAGAHEQLRLLAGLGGADIEGLRRAPPLTALSEDPFVGVAKGVLPDAACAWLIARARELLGPAKTYDAATGQGVAGGGRRNSAAEFALLDMDLVLLAARERLAALAGLPVGQVGAPQILHYAPGETFSEHYDFLDPALPGPAQDLAQRGQRVATALVYLNDEGLEGGETHFPELGIRHRGARGDALVFRNVDEAGHPDRRTLHAGLPPTKGEKWLLSLWIRDRAPPGVGDPRFIEALKPR